MSNNGQYKPHAIQLVSLRVVELAIKVDVTAPKDTELGEFSIETASSKYNAEKHRINVKMRVVSGENDEDGPLQLKVEVVGVFKVDESAFPVDKIAHWADHNAPLILYPYVRENVYSLTNRAGFSQALLPLLEIPTFRVTAPSERVSQTQISDKLS